MEWDTTSSAPRPLGLELYDVEMVKGTLNVVVTTPGWGRPRGAHQGQSRDFGVAGRERPHCRTFHAGRLEPGSGAQTAHAGTLSSRPSEKS